MLGRAGHWFVAVLRQADFDLLQVLLLGVLQRQQYFYSYLTALVFNSNTKVDEEHVDADRLKLTFQ